MEATVSAITRHPNIFTALPGDMRNVLFGKLDGRSLARLGGSSYFLHYFVKKATQIWKQLYLDNNVSRTELIDWREKYTRRELINRNIRCHNATEYHLNLEYEPETTYLCVHDLYYILKGNSLFAYDKKGKLSHTISSLSANIKFSKIDDNTLIASIGKALIIKGRDFEVQIPEASATFAHGDGQVAYIKDDLDQAVWLYSIEDKSTRCLKNLRDCKSFIGIHQNFIFAQYTAGIAVYDSATETNEFISGHVYCSSYYFAYPFIIFKYTQPARLSLFDFDTKKISPIESFGDLVQNGSNLFLYNGNGIEQWSADERKFTLFAKVFPPRKLIVESDRLIGLWNYTLCVWNIQTKEEISNFKFDIMEPGLLTQSFVDDNLFYRIPNGSPYISKIFDLSRGKFIREDGGGSRFIHAYNGSLLLSRMVPGSLLYFTRDYTQPLPKK